MNLYAFRNRFGSWSQPFLAHTDSEAVELVKASLKGKELSYSDAEQELYCLCPYNLDDDKGPFSFMRDADLESPLYVIKQGSTNADS